MIKLTLMELNPQEDVASAELYLRQMRIEAMPEWRDIADQSIRFVGLLRTTPAEANMPVTYYDAQGRRYVYDRGPRVDPRTKQLADVERVYAQPTLSCASFEGAVWHYDTEDVLQLAVENREVQLMQSPMENVWQCGVHTIGDESSFRHDLASISRWMNVAGISLETYGPEFIPTISSCLESIYRLSGERHTRQLAYVGGGLALNSRIDALKARICFEVMDQEDGRMLTVDARCSATENTFGVDRLVPNPIDLGILQRVRYLLSSRTIAAWLLRQRGLRSR